MCMNNFNKIKSLAITLLLPAVGFCQDETTVKTTSYFTNVLFLTLLITIIVLAILILTFSTVFKNFVRSDFFYEKYNSKKNDNSTSIKNITTVLFFLMSFSMMAQETVLAIKDDGRIGGIDQFTFYFMIVLIIIELLVLGVMFYQFNFLVKTNITDTISSEKNNIKASESKLLLSLTDAVAIEDEDSILLDHNYDGIKELDNNLPPWWKYMFYATILSGVIYLVHFHVLKTGDLQTAEYDKAMAQAKIEVDEYMKTSANNVDENTVKLLTEASDITAGKDVFTANCAACHGATGGSTPNGIGPNLTDDYWLHGGGLQDVFKTIKYGWAEKGMKSWKEDLSPMQIAQVTSYIKSLKGTNPPNGKSPQGDLYIEGGASTVSDSTSVTADSLNVQIKVDTLKAASVATLSPSKK